MDIYEKTKAFYNSANTEKRIIGESWLGRNLYAVKCGMGSPVGIAVYAVHGREFITAELAFKQFETGVVGSVWLLPLVNPDGALLSQVGLSSAHSSKYFSFLSSFTEEERRLWKANARGVDLNVNFDADYGMGVKNSKVRGVENCIGECAFSEIETQALKAFTELVAPDYTISYHTKGEEIYWHYGQTGAVLARDRRLAETLSRSCGYPLKTPVGSVGGYKDWCIQTLHIPAFTVEAGRDDLPHPLTTDEVKEDILKKNETALFALSEAVAREKGRIGNEKTD